MYRVNFTVGYSDVNDTFYYQTKPNLTVILNHLGRNKALAAQIHGEVYNQFYDDCIANLNSHDEYAYNALFTENAHVYSRGIDVEPIMWEN